MVWALLRNEIQITLLLSHPDKKRSRQLTKPMGLHKVLLRDPRVNICKVPRTAPVTEHILSKHQALILLSL